MPSNSVHIWPLARACLTAATLGAWFAPTRAAMNVDVGAAADTSGAEITAAIAPSTAAPSTTAPPPSVPAPTPPAARPINIDVSSDATSIEIADEPQTRAPHPSSATPHVATDIAALHLPGRSTG